MNKEREENKLKTKQLELQIQQFQIHNVSQKSKELLIINISSLPFKETIKEGDLI